MNDLGLSSHQSQIQSFYFVSCPWRFAEKLEAGFNAGVVDKTINGNAVSEAIPPIILK